MGARAIILFLAMLGAGCGGHEAWHEETIEDRFFPRGIDETDALGCMRESIGLAETLLADPAVSEDSKATLRRDIGEARAALQRYDDLRQAGGTQVMVMGGLRTACLGILADDVMGGVANDVLLIPLALAAALTYVVTTSPARAGELRSAWSSASARIHALEATVAGTLALMTARGNVADTGIMDEVHEMVRRWRMPPDDKDAICRALAMLLEAAKNAKDTRRQQRIQTTQKARKCRDSRANRE